MPRLLFWHYLYYFISFMVDFLSWNWNKKTPVMHLYFPEVSDLQYLIRRRYFTFFVSPILANHIKIKKIIKLKNQCSKQKQKRLHFWSSNVFGQSDAFFALNLWPKAIKSQKQFGLHRADGKNISDISNFSCASYRTVLIVTA